jgi:hypothetical protein
VLDLNLQQPAAVTRAPTVLFPRGDVLVWSERTAASACRRTDWSCSLDYCWRAKLRKTKDRRKDSVGLSAAGRLGVLRTWSVSGH